MLGKQFKHPHSWWSMPPMKMVIVWGWWILVLYSQWKFTSSLFRVNMPMLLGNDDFNPTDWRIGVSHFQTNLHLSCCCFLHTCMCGCKSWHVWTVAIDVCHCRLQPLKFWDILWQCLLFLTCWFQNLCILKWEWQKSCSLPFWPILGAVNSIFCRHTQYPSIILLSYYW